MIIPLDDAFPHDDHGSQVTRELPERQALQRQLQVIPEYCCGFLDYNHRRNLVQLALYSKYNVNNDWGV